MESSEKRFSQYAQYYDLFYQDKNYVSESLFINQLIEKNIPNDKKNISILDIGCGTGIHAIELSSYGYEVDGSDISLDMINIAKKRASEAGKNINFYNESFQTAHNIAKKYDVILALFSSINYVISDQDLSLAFKNINNLLNENGILIFDFWNGDAVTKDYSPQKNKVVESGEIKIERETFATIQKSMNLITVDFNFNLYKNDKSFDKFSEKHELRYFFLNEMNKILSSNKFEVKYSCPFNNIDAKLDKYDWNVTYVAEKLGKKN